MELRDLIITPLLIILVYVVAYFIRGRFTDVITRRYFFPALTVKIIGALSLGLVYQFYYDGGDTFNYHTFGSRVIWEALMENPVTGLKLIFFSSEHPDPATFRYASRILFYSDSSSYFVIRMAAILNIFTFSAYSATAVLFAVISFIGSWLFFLAFYRQYPDLHKWIAVSAFFIPSVFFWGSGILKDTIILACLGSSTYEVKKIFIDKHVTVKSFIILLVSLLAIYEIKKYVLLCFLPAALFWIFIGNLSKIGSPILKILLVPLVVAVTVASGYFAVLKVGASDPRYALDKLAKTARITAYDIGFYTGRNAGSGYSLGQLDDSFGSLLRLSPQAINVSLFRPYLWEVKNPLMLLSALESLALLGFTAYLILFRGLRFFRAFRNPTVLFCLIFSITFAFAVGVSTFNFGTLARYKIPLLPFYLIALVLIADQTNRDKKLGPLEVVE
jgi:hypothetical protein